jgi:cell cycle arrest protein BUB2
VNSEVENVQRGAAVLILRTCLFVDSHPKAVLTLCAGTPPLQQLLQLWDYLLSFGTHLSILCIVAQLLLIRDELMASPHPMKLLRQFPDLNAKSIIGVATTLVRDLDDALYDDLVHHMVEL